MKVSYIFILFCGLWSALQACLNLQCENCVTSGMKCKFAVWNGKMKCMKKTEKAPGARFIATKLSHCHIIAPVAPEIINTRVTTTPTPTTLQLIVKTTTSKSATTHLPSLQFSSFNTPQLKSESESTVQQSILAQSSTSVPDENNRDGIVQISDAMYSRPTPTEDSVLMSSDTTKGITNQETATTQKILIDEPLTASSVHPTLFNIDELTAETTYSQKFIENEITTQSLPVLQTITCVPVIQAIPKKESSDGIENTILQPHTSTIAPSITVVIEDDIKQDNVNIERPLLANEEIATDTNIQSTEIYTQTEPVIEDSENNVITTVVISTPHVTEEITYTHATASSPGNNSDKAGMGQDTVETNSVSPPPTSPTESTEIIILPESSYQTTPSVSGPVKVQEQIATEHYRPTPENIQQSTMKYYEPAEPNTDSATTTTLTTVSLTTETPVQHVQNETMSSTPLTTTRGTAQPTNSPTEIPLHKPELVDVANESIMIQHYIPVDLGNSTGSSTLTNTTFPVIENPNIATTASPRKENGTIVYSKYVRPPILPMQSKDDQGTCMDFNEVELFERTPISYECERNNTRENRLSRYARTLCTVHDMGRRMGPKLLTESHYYYVTHMNPASNYKITCFFLRLKKKICFKDTEKHLQVTWHKDRILKSSLFSKMSRNETCDEGPRKETKPERFCRHLCVLASLFSHLKPSDLHPVDYAFSNLNPAISFPDECRGLFYRRRFCT